MSVLTEKELTVIGRIGNNGGLITQRQIAQYTGLSLGLTNLILKRLTKTGYVKIRQITSRKIQYILTRKGINEKVRKSYSYISRTINEVRSVKKILVELLIAEHENGVRRVGVIGSNELSDIAWIAAMSVPDMTIIRLNYNDLKDNCKDIDIALDCYTDSDEPKINFKDVEIRIIRLIDHIIREEEKYGRERDLSARLS